MPGASPIYPTALPDMTALRTVVDDVDDVIASDHNDSALEIIALATEIGLLPKGSCVDLKSRIGISLSDDGHILPSEYITTIPTYPTSLGSPGQRAIGSGFSYFCIATDSWERSTLLTW